MIVVDRNALEILSSDNDHRTKKGSDYGQKNNNFIKSLILSIVLFAVGSVIAGAAWWAMSDQPVQVDVVRVHETPLDHKTNSSPILSAAGYVVARRIATVSSNVTGKISELLIEEGMLVEEGQVLARLDEKKVMSQMDLAKSRLELTKAEAGETQARLLQSQKNLQRLETLSKDGLVSISNLDDARAEYSELNAIMETNQKKIKVAQDDVTLSSRELDEYVIRAPFSGVVIAKNAQPGEIISPISAGDGYTRTGICTIVDMSSLEIEVDVNEAYIHRVNPGQKVEAVLNAYPDWHIPATVINLVPTADRQKATVKVRIKFDNLDYRTLPDMGAQVRFFEDTLEDGTSTQAQDTPQLKTLIPRSAMLNDSRGDYVYVIDDKHRAKRRDVISGSEYGDAIGIQKGLTEGELVVRLPGKELKNNALVTFN